MVGVKVMSSKNVGGRPRKYEAEILISEIKEYIDSEGLNNQKLKLTKVAEYLKEKGFNVIYQDLSRNKEVKSFIDSHNEGKSNESNKVKVVNKEKKGSGGRPKKFDEEFLLKGVISYIQKNKDNPQIIRVTQVASYLKDLGLNVNYQDLKRYNGVNQYIENYNKKLRDIIFQEGVYSLDLESDTPIYKRVDVKEFLKNNKTEESITHALNLLNNSNEKLTKSYSKLENKVILQGEKILKLNAIKKQLEEQINNMSESHEKAIRELKSENDRLRSRQRVMAKRMAFWEQFINEHHYDKMADYALYLEKAMNAHAELDEGLLDKEKFETKSLDMRDIADKYNYVMLSAENRINHFTEIEQNILDIEKNINNIKSIELDDIKGPFENNFALEDKSNVDEEVINKLSDGELIDDLLSDVMGAFNEIDLV